MSNFPCSSGATQCFGIRGPRCVANKSGEGGAGVRERRGDWESAAADGWRWWWWGGAIIYRTRCVLLLSVLWWAELCRDG